MKVTTEQLVGILTDMTNVVGAHDSFEGNINYVAAEEPGYWHVYGMYRVGNSIGQGGSVLLEKEDIRFPAIIDIATIQHEIFHGLEDYVTDIGQASSSPSYIAVFNSMFNHLLGGHHYEERTDYSDLPDYVANICKDPTTHPKYANIKTYFGYAVSYVLGYFMDFASQVTWQVVPDGTYTGVVTMMIPDVLYKQIFPQFYYERFNKA